MNAAALVREHVLSDPNRRRFLQYIAVGVLGLAINEAVLFVATGLVGLSYVVGGTLSRVVSIGVNYLVNDSWTWRGRGSPGLRGQLVRAAKYGATRLVGIGIGLGSLVVFVEVLGLNYLVANLFAVGVGLVWGFTASERWVWGTDSDGWFSGHRWTALRTRIAEIDRYTWYVVGFAVLLCCLFSAYSISLYRGYSLTGSDLGAYVHMFATTLSNHGFLVQGKPRVSHPSGSYWGAHFSLTLLVFLPLYALVPSPETLLVAKSVAVAASIPMFWLVARRHIASDAVAGLLVASYALNPFLWSAWLFDFQEQCLLPILVFAAYYAYDRQRHAAFLCLLALALLTNEFEIYLVAGALVGLAVVTYRRGHLGERARVLGAAAVLVVAAKALATFVIAHFSTGWGIPIVSLAPPFRPFLSGTQVTVLDLLGVVAAHPSVAVSSLSTDLLTKFLFFVAFFVPVLFLSLYDEISVGALIPFLGFAWVFAGHSVYYVFGAHYPFYLLPFLYIGAARSFGRFLPPVTTPTTAAQPVSTDGNGSSGPLSLEPPQLSAQNLAVRALVVVLVLNVCGSVVVGATYDVAPHSNAHTRTIDAAIDTIPQGESLLTQNDIYPHVADRPNAQYVVNPQLVRSYQQRYGDLHPEYVLLDTHLRSRTVDWSRPVLDVLGPRLSTEYGLYRYEDGVYVFKRGYDGPTKRISGSGVVTDVPPLESAARSAAVAGCAWNVAVSDQSGRQGSLAAAINQRQSADSRTWCHLSADVVSPADVGRHSPSRSNAGASIDSPTTLFQLTHNR